ncbi:GNAT family N-acetyltransferase [Marinomonas sp. FW-1]|uniref:GNAT family N-acetyltransferase n=1 Tax=Marinomonas sp. FW-1 TaxID=2071621 RepID=UPI0010C0B2FE|nr:GNAT family N-acetyltransferase [Marinomonas sp. FW-1]
MIVYRQAELDELFELKKLLWNQGPNEWNYLTEEGVDAEFTLIEQGSAAAMVAVDSDKEQIIGFAVLIDGSVSPDYLTKYSALNEFCFIGDVVVSQAYSGQGIATKLLECCIKEAKEKQVQTVLIERHEENLASAGMMRKAGFQVVDTFYDPDKRSSGSRKTSVLEYCIE